MRTSMIGLMIAAIIAITGCGNGHHRDTRTTSNDSIAQVHAADSIARVHRADSIRKVQINDSIARAKRDTVEDRFYEQLFNKVGFAVSLWKDSILEVGCGEGCTTYKPLPCQKGTTQDFQFIIVMYPPDSNNTRYALDEVFYKKKGPQPTGKTLEEDQQLSHYYEWGNMKDINHSQKISECWQQPPSDYNKVIKKTPKRK